MPVRHVLFALCILPLACACWAAETEEPDVRFPDDARLDQKVTISILGRPLHVICDELTGKTGVSITARGEAKERKLTLIYTDTPVRDILTDIHDITNYALSKDWTVDPKEDPQYIIWRDTRCKWIEEAAREDAERKREEETAAYATDMFTSYREALALDPASPEFEKLKDTNPWAYRTLKDPIGRSHVEFVFSLGWDALSSIMEGGYIKQPFSELTGAQQQMYADILTAGEKWFHEKFPEDVPEGEEPKTWTRADLHDKDLLVTFSLDGLEVSTGEGGGTWMLPRRPEGWALERHVIRTQIEGMPDDEARRLSTEEGAEWQRSQKEQHDKKVDAMIAADPELAKTVALEMPKDQETFSTAQILKCFADGTGLCVCAHHFTRRPTGFAAREARIVDHLDHIGDLLNFDWRKDGGTVYLSDKQWWKSIRSEIPEHLIAQWTKRLEENGRFEFADLVAIVPMLSEEQIAALTGMHSPPELRKALGRAIWYSHAPALRFYASLTDSEARRASQDTLPLSSLTEVQYTLFEQVFRCMREPQYTGARIDTQTAGFRFLQGGSGDRIILRFVANPDVTLDVEFNLPPRKETAGEAG
jgi:hypothetical protein